MSVVKLTRARRAFEAWLEAQEDYPSGVAKDAGVSDEAARRWLRLGAWPSMESAIKLRITRGLDLNALADGTRQV